MKRFFGWKAMNRRKVCVFHLMRIYFRERAKFTGMHRVAGWGGGGQGLWSCGKMGDRNSLLQTHAWVATSCRIRPLRTQHTPSIVLSLTCTSAVSGGDSSIVPITIGTNGQLSHRILLKHCSGMWCLCQEGNRPLKKKWSSTKVRAKTLGTHCKILG